MRVHVHLPLCNIVIIVTHCISLLVYCLYSHLWGVSFMRTGFVHVIHSLIYEASKSALHIVGPQLTLVK